MFYKIPLTRRGNSAEDFCLPECWQQNSQMITSRADSMLTVSSIGKWSRFLGSCEANLVKTALCPKGGTLPLTRHRLGYFRTHDSLGGVGSDPPPCYLENQWSYRAPRGGVRKVSTRPSQSTLKILRLRSTFGSRSGQRSNSGVLHD